MFQAVAMDALSLEQQLPPYTFFTQSASQQQTQVPSGLPQSSMMQGSSLQRGTQLPPLTVSISTVPQSPPGIQTPSSLAIDINSVSFSLNIGRKSRSHLCYIELICPVLLLYWVKLYIKKMKAYLPRIT